MDDKNGLTLKQHVMCLALSALVSGTCFYLDLKYENLPHHILSAGAASHSQATLITSAKFYIPPVN